jgi:hypothetical protein
MDIEIGRLCRNYVHLQVPTGLMQSVAAVVQVPAVQAADVVAQSPPNLVVPGSAIVELSVPMRSPSARKTNPVDPNPNDPAERMRRFMRDKLLCRNHPPNDRSAPCRAVSPQSFRAGRTRPTIRNGISGCFALSV